MSTAKMASAAATAAGVAVRKKPSAVKEMFYGLSLGIAVASVWKMYHLNLKRKTEEFYDALERGEITTVIHVVDESVPYQKTMEMFA